MVLDDAVVARDEDADGVCADGRRWWCGEQQKKGCRRSNQSIAQWVLLVRQPISSSGVRFWRGFNG
jgi:hypothetical protein